MTNIFLFILGFFLLLFLFTEDFWRFLRKVRQRLTARPGLKFLAYPLTAALLLAAAGCILFFLWSVVTTKFSYD